MGGLSIIVGCVALVPATLALALRARVPAVVTFGLGHIAATGFLVAFCSSDRVSPYTTWLLQKRADGHISTLSRILYYPYHLGLMGKLWVQRRKSSEPLYDRVTPQLYIGGWPEEASWLPPGQPSVLDVTCELPRTHHNHYLNLPCWDTQAPNAAQIQQGVDWVQRVMGDGHSVYIHCAHGHGRSATVLAAVLIATGQASTAEEAVAVMRAARPRVRLNKPQAAALRSWIATQHGSSSGGGGSSDGGGTCMETQPLSAVRVGGTADVSMGSGTPTKRQSLAVVHAAAENPVS